VSAFIDDRRMKDGQRQLGSAAQQRDKPAVRFFKPISVAISERWLDRQEHMARRLRNKSRAASKQQLFDTIAIQQGRRAIV